MMGLSPRRIIAADCIVARLTLATLIFIAATIISPLASAYDSTQFQAAIESLNAMTAPEMEAKAAAGDVMAQNVMGMAYKYGLGVRQDHARSVHWFRKAAEQGDSDAQFNLGRIYGKAFGAYAKGRAVPQDDKQAVLWYRRSAEQGYRPAQIALAEIYAEGGTGVARDPVQAYVWMSLAASAGDSAASHKLPEYASRLTAEERVTAQDLIVNWRGRQRPK